MILDSETKAVELPHDHGDELRLWLRLLTCTNLIEGEVRSRLRERFDVTLPRFDLMAQLDKAPDGMTLSDVSKRMMVSNGNVTGLVERLVESGHLEPQGCSRIDAAARQGQGLGAKGSQPANCLGRWRRPITKPNTTTGPGSRRIRL
jgi:hypothetical protein